MTTITPSTTITTPKTSKNPPSAIRPDILIVGILFLLVLISQLQMPLTQFQTRQESVSPAVLQRLANSETAKQYFYANQQVSNDDDNDNDYDDAFPKPHDSRDTIHIGLTPPAIKLMENYQYHNSQHSLNDQENECHERTNRGSEDDISKIIDDGEWCPELHKRKFIIVDWVDHCEEESNQHSSGKSGVEFLEEFVRSVAWAIVTGRTVLFREMGLAVYDEENKVDSTHNTRNKNHDLSSSCEGDECAERYDVSKCKGRARLDPWVPTYQSWKQEYGWDDSIIEVVQNLSKLEYDTTTEETLLASPKVIKLKDPPPLSINALHSIGAIQMATTLIDFGMAYGMILDETILFKEADLPEHDISLDSMDGARTQTKRYAVQASAARTSKCPLHFEQPCVIYQIGQEAVGPSACTIEVATNEEDLSTHRAVMEILAMTGNAIDGVVLDPNLAVGAYLMEFLRYRGRLQIRNFQLKGCWV